MLVLPFSSFRTRSYEDLGILQDILTSMRTSAEGCGHDLYIIGDHVFGNAPESSDVSFLNLDAVTNIDIYGSMGMPMKYAGKDLVDSYYEEQAKWQELANSKGSRYIPAVSPGFNDRGTRLELNRPPLSRKLTSDSFEGSLFFYELQKALPLVDSKADNLILVNSFNQWHEDTQIEPTGSWGSATSLPSYMTYGLQYEGYGKLYLNIIRSLTESSAENFLIDKGNNGIPSDAFPLGLCEGECDRDSDCDSDLVCYSRDSNEPVPFCEGTGTSSDDYCTLLTPNPTAAPATRGSVIIDVLSKYMDFDTIHQQAYDWLADTDSWFPYSWQKSTFVTGPDGEAQSLWDALLVDRYALAELYYETNGDGWTTNTGWLSNQSVCYWYGTSCKANGQLLDLYLGMQIGFVCQNV